ncbi:hypothetical protein NQZ68_002956 [Dissostichus eleginoides]|nr:hypothetical protein NQZ68_002956 [Dissostichus eleginoides]
MSENAPAEAVLEPAKHGLPSQSWGNIIQLPPCDPRHTTNPVVHSSVAKLPPPPPYQPTATLGIRISQLQKTTTTLS